MGKVDSGIGKGVANGGLFLGALRSKHCSRIDSWHDGMSKERHCLHPLGITATSVSVSGAAIKDFPCSIAAQMWLFLGGVGVDTSVLQFT